MYPGIINESLLSIGQICDNKRLELFSKNNLHIFKEDKLILTGTRKLSDVLWDIPFPSTLQNESKNETLVNN